MTDFLKSHPFVSMDDYMWRMNPCMIRLMTIDNTHIHYLSEKQRKNKKSKKVDGGNLANDLGAPIFE